MSTLCVASSHSVNASATRQGASRDRSTARRGNSVHGRWRRARRQLTHLLISKADAGQVGLHRIAIFAVLQNRGMVLGRVGPFLAGGGMSSTILTRASAPPLTN
jgi:hypothetical protein